MSLVHYCGFDEFARQDLDKYRIEILHQGQARGDEEEYRGMGSQVQLPGQADRFVQEG